MMSNIISSDAIKAIIWTCKNFTTILKLPIINALGWDCIIRFIKPIIFAYGCKYIYNYLSFFFKSYYTNYIPNLTT